MLTLTFLGIGSAFAKRSYNSNSLVEIWSKGPEAQTAPDDTLLIDFGITGPLALHGLMQRAEFGYLQREGWTNYPAIRRVFVTHLHGDHVGGLEELVLVNKHVFARKLGRPIRPELLAPQVLLDNLWEHTLKGGLSATAGGYQTLSDFFEVRPLEAGESIRFGEHYRLTPFRTDHVRVFAPYDWPSYGLWLQDERSGEGAFFSGDTRFDWPEHREMLERARIAFHEVQLFELPGVHSLLSELRTLPEHIRRKMYVYHVSDDWDGGRYADVPRLFAGFAEQAKRYTVLD